MLAYKRIVLLQLDPVGVVALVLLRVVDVTAFTAAQLHQHPVALFRHDISPLLLLF